MKYLVDENEPCTFAMNLVSDPTIGIKREVRLKIRRYPRSCKLYQLFVLQATVLIIDGKATNRE
jgi:hypothetical protein